MDVCRCRHVIRSFVSSQSVSSSAPIGWPVCVWCSCVRAFVQRYRQYSRLNSSLGGNTRENALATITITALPRCHATVATVLLVAVLVYEGGERES